MGAFDAVAAAMATSLPLMFGESVEVRLPAEGALNGVSGARTTTYTTSAVAASVGRDSEEHPLGEGTAVVECTVTVPVDSLAFDATDKCEVRIVARDTTSQWRQVVGVELVVSGTMIELRTRRKQ